MEPFYIQKPFPINLVKSAKFFCTFVYYGQLQAKINELQQNYVIGDYSYTKAAFLHKRKGKNKEKSRNEINCKSSSSQSKKDRKDLNLNSPEIGESFID